MPSTYSMSSLRPWPSSTVTTPSLPTLSITSAIISPISRVARADGGDVGDVVLGLDRLGQGLDLVHEGGHAALDAPLEAHRVGAGGDVLESLADDGLRQHDAGGGAVTGDVVRLGRDLFEHLGAHVLVGLLELDVAGDGDAVIGHGRCAELLVEHGIPAARAERDLDGLGHLVHAPLKRPARLLAELELLRHGSLRPP